MNLIPPFLRKQKSLADVPDEELFSKFSRQELMAVSRMVADAKARDFIEVQLGVKIQKFTGYDSYLRAGCTKVWASMRAVHLISSLVISANFKVVDTKSDNPDEAVEPKPREQEWSAFAKGGFIAKPNPYDTWEELVELTVAHLEFTGNAYWVKEDYDLLGRPTAVYPLLPQHVELVPDVKTKVAMYEYTVQGKTLKFRPEQVLHFRYPHPNSLMLGLGSIESGEEIYKKAIGETDLKLKFLENGAQPSGVMTLDDGNVTDEEEWEKLRKKFTKEYAGRKNAGKVAFLNGKWSYHRLGLTTDEMQAIEAEKWTVEQIFLNHGVPLSVAGIREAANFACLPAGELVTTPNGPVPIEQLQAKDSIYQFDPEKGAVVVPVEAIIEQPDAEVIEVSTTNRTLRASDNHPILCVKRIPGTGRMGKRVSAELEYRRADEIKVGDMIVTLDSLPEGTGKIPLPVFGQRQAAYALGQYVGDGSGASVTRSRVGDFTVATHELEGYQEEVAEAFEQGFGVRVSRCRTSIRFHSAKLARQMVLAGFGGTSGNKSIPEWVFNLPNDLKLEFIAGLMDADGTVDERGTMVFGVANRELADQFRHLIMSVGIPTGNLRPCHQSTNFGEVTNWRFSCGILSENKRIPLCHPKKAMRLRQAKDRMHKKKGVGIPASLRLPSDFQIPSGFGVQKVTGVRSLGMMPVYDLATIGHHNFIASGVVTHNTSRQDEHNFRRYKIVPVIDIIVGKINADGFLQAAGAGLKLTYELYGVIDVEQIAKVHLPLMREGVLTRNEMREMIGLRRIESPSMDQIMVTMNTIPIELAGLANLSNLDTMRIFGEIIGGEVENATDTLVPPTNDPAPEDKPEIPINTVTPDKGGKGAAPLRTYPAKPSKHAKGRKGGR